MSADPDSEMPPAVRAARKGRAAGRLSAVRAERAYPPAPADDDPEATAVQLAATRGLLTATTPQQVAAVVATLVRDLGGGLVPARLAQPERTLQLDVSLGVGEPLLPWAEPVSVAAMRLSRVLPPFVQDARQVADRLRSEVRRAEEAEHDGRTGVLSRRAWMRRLGTAGPADSVCLVDLDLAPDLDAQAREDAVLRAVAGLRRQALRPGDAVGRVTGDVLACLCVDTPAPALAGRLDLLRAQGQRAVAGSYLLAAVAQVSGHRPRAALDAADLALSRARASSQDATAIATVPDSRPEDRA